MRRRIMLMFEHPACNDVVVDIHLPLPDPITESTEAMAARVIPACPICKEPMRYAGWSSNTAAAAEEDDTRRHARGRAMIEGLRAFTGLNARGHAPLIARDALMIVGCTCGWRTPPDTTDSDDAFAAHCAISRTVDQIVEGKV